MANVRSRWSALVSAAIALSLQSVPGSASCSPTTQHSTIRVMTFNVLHEPLRQVLGTWAGTSTCVGNRSACKDENVVYRFAPIDGRSSRVRLFADKVIEGKRVPMGALDFTTSKDRLSCEFKRGSAHGLWEFTVSGDSIVGTLVLLPGRDLARRVRVHRVAEGSVPPAPAD